MIKAEGIIKNFDTLQVLKGIDIEIKKGEIVSVIGPSGAGKTTLLQILGTLDKADSGKLWINDKDISSLSESQMADFRNKNIGFVFQFHQLLPEFTALENVMIPGLISGRKSAEVKTKAKELLDYLNLSERLLHKPSQMSGGEKQRVAVARALINEPCVIFADEPSGSLDTEHKIELHKLFFELRKEMNQTFVIVTHDESLSLMSDRIIQIKDGLII